MITPLEKTTYTLLNELRHYVLAVVDQEPKTRWTRDTLFRVPATLCAWCLHPFVAYAVQACCSRSCAMRVRRSKNRRDTVTRYMQPVSQPMHPELAAWAAIHEALQPLDEAAGQRVLTYARDWIDTARKPAPVLHLVLPGGDNE